MDTKHILDLSTDIHTKFGSTKSQLVHLHSQFLKYQYAHTRASYYYQKWSIGMTIPIITFNSVMVILTGSFSDSVSNAAAWNWLNITQASAFSLTTILVGIKEYLKFEQKLQFHIHRANIYSQYATEVENLLLDDEAQADNSVKELNKKFFTLLGQNSEFIIPEHILRDADDKFKKVSSVIEMESS